MSEPAPTPTPPAPTETGLVDGGGTSAPSPPKNPPHRPVDPNSERQKRLREKQDRAQQRDRDAGAAARAHGTVKNPLKLEKAPEGEKANGEKQPEPPPPKPPEPIDEKLVDFITPATTVVCAELINRARERKGKGPADEKVIEPVGALSARVLVKRFPQLMRALGDEMMLITMFLVAIDSDVKVNVVDGKVMPARAGA